ncbi:PH domain-containing protein [Rhizohabitans arisaemae]|uniref:PH domain-containing protein n=1 Tax=Rhizohabitans arisaemae TaxID=2720610 RepID=UPI0024B077DE|nr:PH domain-containing protein [Rhizohabitans arisaemae]
MNGVNLRPPRHQADPRVVIWWTVQSLLFAVPLLAVLTTLHLIFTSGVIWLTAGLVVLALILLIPIPIVPRMHYRLNRWEVTDEAVYTKTGWIFQEWRIAPMSRIQTVDTAQGPLQRRYGISDVTVTTASTAGALRIVGLDQELAAELTRRLTEITQATPGDAT